MESNFDCVQFVWWMNEHHTSAIFYSGPYTIHTIHTNTIAYTHTYWLVYARIHTCIHSPHAHDVHVHKQKYKHTHMHIDMNERARTSTTRARELTYQYCDSHTSWSSQWNERDMNAFIVAYVLIELEFEWTFCGWHIWNW